MADEEIIVVQDEEEPMQNPNWHCGVRFGAIHSLTDLGLWTIQRPDTGSPAPKLNTIEVPGMNGTLDMTEVNAGGVKYANRQMVFEFGSMCNIPDQAGAKAKIMSALHGKYFEEIGLDEDIGWHYSGRCTVEFSEIESWRFKAIVRVDAYPFAKADVETWVDLYPEDAFLTTVQNYLAPNVSTQTYNSKFKLGTKTFPQGLSNPDGLPRLEISWPSNAPIAPFTKKVYITDGSHQFTYTISGTELNIRHAFILFSVMTNDGLDLDKVYDVTISGIGKCSIYTEFQAMKTTLQLSDYCQPVIPTFFLDADVPAHVFINGIEYEIPVGQSQNTDIEISPGQTHSVLVPSRGITINSFNMVYWEEKL